MNRTTKARPRHWRRPLLRLALALLLLIGVAAVWLYRHADTIVLGAEGYVFGQPLVLMDLTRQAHLQGLGPENQLRRVRQFPGPEFRDVVRPNVDTLYTTTFVDLGQGPWVFHVPPSDGRYELMAWLDGWTDVFAAPGSRTHGRAGGTYLLLGPGDNTPVPAGMQVLRASTRMAWLIGRTQVLDPSDLQRVHALQDGLALLPLARWQRGERQPGPVAWQPGPRHAAPVQQLRDMPTDTFFERLATLMRDNPPRPQDAPMLRKLQRLGVAPGQPPQWGLSDRWAAALGRRIADWRIAQELRRPRELHNGWQTPPDILGRYGTAYNIRAVVALVGLGANPPEDALYPNTRVDTEGRPLSGDARYRLRFAPGSAPPVKAFWSVTAYGTDDFLQNVPARRHAVNSHDPLVPNPDGSIDLLIQATPPASATANWLPVRAGEPFLLNARLYWPEADALTGRWHMPGVERLD